MIYSSKKLVQPKLTIENAIGFFRNYRQVTKNLKLYELIYINQVTMSDDNKKLQPYSNIKKATGHNSKNRKPLWYKLLEKKTVFKSESPFDVSKTQNNHTKK